MLRWVIAAAVLVCCQSVPLPAPLPNGVGGGGGAGGGASCASAAEQLEARQCVGYATFLESCEFAATDGREYPVDCIAKAQSCEEAFRCR